MDLEKLLRTKQFLEDMSASIRNIIAAAFPRLTREQKEDVDHEVKLKIWRMVSRGKKIANLRSYLWRVVYTTALDVLEEKLKKYSWDDIVESGREELLNTPNLSPADCNPKNNELKMLIEKAVESLPERRKKVLQLHLTGMDLKEMARVLEWSEHQVRHLLYRGLSDLKEKLKKLNTKAG